MPKGKTEDVDDTGTFKSHGPQMETTKKVTLAENLQLPRRILEMCIDQEHVATREKWDIYNFTSDKLYFSWV